MNTKELYNLIAGGQKPVIEFTEYQHDEAPDIGMRARIVGMHKKDDCIVFHCDLREFEERNKNFEEKTWNDNAGNPTLGWSESSYYPKNKIYELYIGEEENSADILKLVEVSKYYQQYLGSGATISYVEWLENELEKAGK